MRNTLKSIIAATVSAVIAAGAMGQCDVQGFTAGDAGSSDQFGFDVDVDGDKAIVGMYGDNGYSGAAYIFKRTPTGWVQEQRIVPSDPATGDRFGYAVAISGNYAVVGAYFEDAMGTDSGSAYVFRYNGVTWVQQQKLTAADGANYDFFGKSVDISGSVALVGSLEDDDLGTGSGAVYAYRLNGTTWSQTQKLRASDGTAYDYFGGSVAISGNAAIIGAYWDDVAVGDCGSAYTFFYNGSTWVQEQKITAADGGLNDRFGWSVDISGSNAIVGAYLDDDGGADAGSAYVYEKVGSSWLLRTKLRASDAAAGDYFGYSVGIASTAAVVGAYMNDDFGTNSGSSYSFSKSQTTWIQEAKVLPSNGAAGDFFGYSVAISGDRAMVGAYKHDQGATDSGSAYAFGGAGALAGGTDCNDNSIPDACDIAQGTSLDANANGVPDECETGPVPSPDINNDGVVNVNDLLSVISQWGVCPPTAPCSGDVVVNGQVDVSDLLAVIGAWG